MKRGNVNSAIIRYYNMLDNNIEVFKNTRSLSNTKYRAETNKMLEQVAVFEDSTEVPYVADNNKLSMQISFVRGGTVNTAYNLKTAHNRVAMLNFADAKRPGGWVIDGAPTQEENICRCTNLYESLLLPGCAEHYYNKNKKNATDEAHNNEAYADALIYTPDALIFKDDTTYNLVSPKYVDVITSPSPCGYVDNVESIMIRRIEGIIKVCAQYKVTDVVFGAWGCGAFGQNPEVVSKCFCRALMHYAPFDNVVFAIKTTEGSNNDVYDRFVNAFLGGAINEESLL